MEAEHKAQDSEDSPTVIFSASADAPAAADGASDRDDEHYRRTDAATIAPAQEANAATETSASSNSDTIAAENTEMPTATDDDTTTPIAQSGTTHADEQNDGSKSPTAAHTSGTSLSHAIAASVAENAETPTATDDDSDTTAPTAQNAIDRADEQNDGNESPTAAHTSDTSFSHAIAASVAESAATHAHAADDSNATVPIAQSDTTHADEQNDGQKSLTVAHASNSSLSHAIAVIAAENAETPAPAADNSDATTSIAQSSNNHADEQIDGNESPTAAHTSDTSFSHAIAASVAENAETPAATDDDSDATVPIAQSGTDRDNEQNDGNESPTAAHTSDTSHSHAITTSVAETAATYAPAADDSDATAPIAQSGTTHADEQNDGRKSLTAAHTSDTTAPTAQNAIDRADEQIDGNESPTAAHTSDTSLSHAIAANVAENAATHAHAADDSDTTTSIAQNAIDRADEQIDGNKSPTAAHASDTSLSHAIAVIAAETAATHAATDDDSDTTAPTAQSAIDRADEQNDGNESPTAAHTSDSSLSHAIAVIAAETAATPAPAADNSDTTAPTAQSGINSTDGQVDDNDNATTDHEQENTNVQIYDNQTLSQQDTAAAPDTAQVAKPTVAVFTASSFAERADVTQRSAKHKKRGKKARHTASANVSPVPPSSAVNAAASGGVLSAPTFFLAVVAAGIFMLLVALAVFFLYVKAPEQVMVPDIEGKQLTTALLEMQAKELYPKLQLRYTDNPDDAGKVLSQNPIAGAIVKAGTRVTLTVSRGVVIDHVENYVGLKLDDVKIKLQTMFTGSVRPLIVLANPVYKASQAEEGTILEQNPPEGTEISSPVTVQLVVSRGSAYEYSAVPNLVGLTVRELLSRIAQNKLVFDFSSHTASGDEKAGSVTGQQTLGRDFVTNYTRMTIELALPETAQDGLLYGIFQYQATAYPYAVEMKLDAIPETGDRYNVVTFMHTGGSVTMPYAVPKNTELILTIEGREYKRETIE